MAALNKPYPGVFSTPFWSEGNALYWELLLWDLNFAKTPEDKIGMLFWRMHRCARIIFSLSFHLEKMTPQECIDLLVNRVGHERSEERRVGKECRCRWEREHEKKNEHRSRKQRGSDDVDSIDRDK